MRNYVLKIGTNSYFGSREHRADESNRNMMEAENDEKWDQLGESVTLLKNLTSDINNEVRSQNNYLDGMGLSFGSANNMFKLTINKLGNMMQAGGASHMYLMALFVVSVFLIIYFLMKN